MQPKQVSGSALVQDSNGRSKFVTYVSPQEYDRMTPEERDRLHATVGVSTSIPLPGRKGPPETIPEEEFKKASSEEK